MLIGELEQYWDGQKIFSVPEIKLNPGLTVLVGCNGCGKSTFLMHLYNYCEEKEIDHVYFNNLQDGGTQRGIDKVWMSGTNGANGAAKIASFMSASEGETIRMHLEDLAYKIGQRGNDKKLTKTNNFIILLDAIDSGFSIDNVLELKELFNTILKHETRQVYIVVAANEYELANGEMCLDVVTGRYIEFANYDSYRDFILESRKNKDELCCK